MQQKTQITLARMQSGQTGTIREIHGGHGMIDRLAALGIMTGKKITKVSGMVMRGPVTITAGRAHVAIGYGMASRILVEVEPR